MVANSEIWATNLVDSAVDWLGSRVPSTWAVERSRRNGPEGDEAASVDAFIDLRAPNGTYTTLAVEARASMEPRDVEQLLPGLARSLRALAGFVPLLVVAPWLSPRTQELLEAEGLNFLDLTGNALVKLDNPAVFVQAAGATRNPAPPPRGPASIRGAKAARLVRVLADARPPYGVRELAVAAGLTAGYVSRLLDALDRDALIDRGRRGVVDAVDVPALLRAWADGYDVFKRENVSTFAAPNGAAAALGQLADLPTRAAVTGSFAAVRLAPVAAPSMLVVYCDDTAATAQVLGLLVADEGANVTLLRPFDEVVWARATTADGVAFAAPSQVVVDCLSGNGRMPAEGDALLDWMAANEDEWRAPALADLPGIAA
ncbi:MAG: type IV toxin-antitoxin system AbiEi family antitoxin [Solirubrobacteraceae bacterium]